MERLPSGLRRRSRPPEAGPPLAEKAVLPATEGRRKERRDWAQGGVGSATPAWAGGGGANGVSEHILRSGTRLKELCQFGGMRNHNKITEV